VTVQAAVLTPFLRGDAIELGNQLWRKKILPVGDVQYNGRTLHFTKDYNDSLARAYAAQAYDQVSFQMADAKNTHTNDPERHRGEIVAMTSEPDGVWITMRPTEAGAQVLRENPKLGVSARIVEGYARSDGQYFPQAIQHVLGTLDPRIPGLGAWTAIEAANQPAVTIDLSAATFVGQGEETEMPDLNPQQKANLDRLLNLNSGDLDKLLGSAPAAPQTVPAAGDPNPEDLNDQELADLIDAMSDEELAALETEFQAETVASAGATGLSNEAQMAIDLANSRADELERQSMIFQGEFDAQRYENEKRALADLGVPPYITELARPLLEGQGRTVDLSNGSRVDAGQIMRKVLSEYARMADMLDLGVELGSPMDEPDGATASQATQDRQALVSKAKGLMGL
jgi:hypothetical protein